MKEELELLKEFHKKYNVPILQVPTMIDKDRAKLRYNIIKEEVEEYIEGVNNNDLQNIARELADILYSTYGTVIEHGLQDKMPQIFREIHKANMTREYTESKIRKGPDYKEPNLSKFF